MYPLTTLLLLLFMVSVGLHANAIKQNRSFSILGEPKYAVDFTHFDYVDPTAPKGGKITLSALGTFDNFNRYALRGYPAARTDALYDTLFTSSDDEIGSFYPLIAESAHYPSDFSWMEVDIHPSARFHNGTPITAQDVEFTFNKMMKEGVPQFRLYYKGAQVTALSPRTVRFTLLEPDRDKLIGLVTGLSIFPQQFWKHQNLAEPLTTPPLASGPYRISDYKMGQYVVYQRVKDYWAADLPVNRGRNNFDTIRYEYYLDDNVSLEAFRAGSYDVRVEGSPKNWATQYQGKNFSKRYILKQELQDNAAQSTTWLSFNTTRPQFQDRRVRQAITLAFDFNWLNKAFYYHAYQRTRSYFQNTEYEASSLPDTDELQWLTPLKGQIPNEVFDQIYHPPATNGSGDNRQNLLQATTLLKEAGWEIKDQKLVNRNTGQPFHFELMLLSGRESQYVLPFKHNLQRLGITMNIREVDISQFNSRLRSRDFDMMPRTYPAVTYPQPTLNIVWGSAYLDSTYNSPGVQDPAIDRLLQQISDHQGQPNVLLSLGRALDRVLTWHQYMLPMWYSKTIRLSYWDKFSMPATRPTYSLGFDTWWFDVNKATKLPAQRR